MLLTGRLIGSEDAKQLGFINKTFKEKKDMDEYVQHIVSIIAEKPKHLISFGMNIVNRQLKETELKNAYIIASDAMCKNLKEPNAKEGITAFLEKRKPRWS